MTAVINDADEDFDYFQAVDQGYDDNVYDCLQELGVDPYVGFEEANHQILTQTREDEDGVKYLYAYNYCSNDYHENSHIDSVKTEVTAQRFPPVWLLTVSMFLMRSMHGAVKQQRSQSTRSKTERLMFRLL